MNQTDRKHTKEKSAYGASLWQLFITFFKVGAFTFGGGYAMIAILQEELIAKKKWITEQDMLDMIVIAESTPGVIAVNTATSVGYRMHGISGALVATLGVVLPSFLIIYALSFAIQAFENNVWYKAAFTGVRACVTILIVNAFSNLFKQVKWDLFCAILFVISLWVAVFTSFDVIYLILIGGIAGIAYTYIFEAANRAKNLPLAQGEQPIENNFDDTSAQKCVTEQNPSENSDKEESDK